jgi:hypothetical protein
MGDEHIAERYDPAGTGVGRCSKCHMPLTASSSGQRTTLPGSNQKEGDIHNHTFQIIWPSANVLVDNTMVNSCYASGCHANAPGTGNQFISEWSESGHANFKGEPFRHWDRDGSIPTSCAKCHSPHGFNDFALDGVVTGVGARSQDLLRHLPHRGGDGTTLWDNQRPTRRWTTSFPSGLRQAWPTPATSARPATKAGNRKSVSTDDATGGIDNLAFVNIHYFAAAATLSGRRSREATSTTTTRTSGRRPTWAVRPRDTRDTCIECHMNPTPNANHTFFPRVSTASRATPTC